MKKNVKVMKDNSIISSRDRILDAAEMLFCRFGFYGASTRDIAKAAGVGLGVSTYHFGTKEELFRNVIGRRAEEHLRNLNEALDNAISSAGSKPPPAESIIRAFVEPLTLKSLNGGAGWKNYIKLLSQSMNTSQVEEFLKPVVEIYQPLINRYIAEFKRIFPASSAENINLSFYFLQASVIHILSETGTLDRQSDGLCRAGDFETITEAMVPFFSAGFHRLVDRPATSKG